MQAFLLFEGEVPVGVDIVLVLHRVILQLQVLKRTQLPQIVEYIEAHDEILGKDELGQPRVLGQVRDLFVSDGVADETETAQFGEEGQFDEGGHAAVIEDELCQLGKLAKALPRLLGNLAEIGMAEIKACELPGQFLELFAHALQLTHQFLSLRGCGYHALWQRKDGREMRAEVYIISFSENHMKMRVPCQRNLTAFIIITLMRVTQIHVRDARCVREYAYQEDKNSSCRQDMEDCTAPSLRLRGRRLPHR